MEDISKKFGRKVREVCLKQELSQGDVSRRLNLHRSYVSGIERGVRNPSLKVIQKIAKALAVNVDNLLK